MAAMPPPQPQFSGENVAGAPQPMEDTLEITPLGGGKEVGRSCHLLEFRGRSIILDCGIHPGRSGLDALPFLDTVDLSTVDLLLVSHFHIDHAAGVPYLTEKTGFKGRIFMTHATRAVMRLLLSDYIRLLPSGDGRKQGGEGSGGRDGLYDETDLANCCDKVELVDFHQVVEHNGIKFWSYNAGHVLGAAMFYIEIGGVRVLYTGDYSMEEDRHLVPAEVPSLEPHVLIMESTYGTQKHESRDVREALFTSTIERIVQRGGRCLIPTFALGRAQELLLILDEYWKEREDLQQIPVFYASKMATRALRVYQTYINMMNQHVRDQMDVSNPFRFSHVQNLNSVDDLDDTGPCVVLAAPGMLQSGVSRRLFDKWASSERNGVVIAGYSVEGTLAKQLLSEPEEVRTQDGRVQARRCTVVSVSFSAHVDFFQNFSFVEATRPDNIVLVHGEKNEMDRLKGKLVQETNKWPSDRRPTVSSPENGQLVNMKFQRDRRAACVGAAWNDATADVDKPKKRRIVTAGILVRKDLVSTLYADDELQDSSPLAVTQLAQTVRLRLSCGVDGLDFLLKQTFADVCEGTADDEEECDGAFEKGWVLCGSVRACVYALEAGERELVLRWAAAPLGDAVADACACLALHAATSVPASRNAGPCCAPPSTPRDGGDAAAALVRDALSDSFGPDNVTDAEPLEGDEAEYICLMGVALDDQRATCGLIREDGALRADVASNDDALRRRLRKLLERALAVCVPIPTAGA